MMAKKAKAKPAKRKAPVEAVNTSVADERKWRRQNDLRTLRDAEEIRGDPNRMSGAKSEAKKDMAALKKMWK